MSAFVSTDSDNQAILFKFSDIVVYTVYGKA